LKIKICGLSRDEDIDYVNEARPDYVGFVFAESKRQITTALAQYLRFRIVDVITPVGVFVNAPIPQVAALFQNGVISVAQLHGDEDEGYISSLKRKCGTVNNTPIKVIKVIQAGSREWGVGRKQQSLLPIPHSPLPDYYLIDSGAGSGKAFNWKKLAALKISKPWFLAGGINAENIKQAMALNPFALDVSSGAETDGVKDRKKIIELVSIVKKG